MGYLNLIDPWLEERLRLVNSACVDTDAVIADVKRQIKGKILESYRNGQGGRGKRPSEEAPVQGRYTKKYTKPRR